MVGTNPDITLGNGRAFPLVWDMRQKQDISNIGLMWSNLIMDSWEIQIGEVSHFNFSMVE